HDRPPRRIGPEPPARQPPAGEIVLHHGVRFLALTAALALPADQFVARQRAVGDEAEQLVAAQRRKAHRREGQLLGIAEIEFTQRLADRQKAVARRRLAHARPVRHVADFRPLLAGGIALAIDDPIERLPGRLGQLRHRLPELRRHVRPDGEFDHPEAPVLALGAILQKILLIGSRIRAQVELPHAGRKQARRLFENAQLLMPRRHVAVAELRMHNQALLGPPAIERLIGLEVLVAVQRRPLVRLNERGVHVERRLRRRMLRLNRLQKIAVHPPQARHALVRRRDERPSGFPPRLLAGIVKPRKPPARRMRRGQRARPLPPHFAAPRRAAPAECARARPPPAPAGTVRRPPPAGRDRRDPRPRQGSATPAPTPSADRSSPGCRSPPRGAPPIAPVRPRATAPNTREAPQDRSVPPRPPRFRTGTARAPVSPSLTSLVMALIRKSQPISLINQDQRGTSLPLMRNQGAADDADCRTT